MQKNNNRTQNKEFSSNFNKKPCHYLFHLGRCNNKAGQECTYSHDPALEKNFPKSTCPRCKPQNSQKQPCHYHFHVGKCSKKESECPNSHDQAWINNFPNQSCKLCKSVKKIRIPCHFYHLKINHDLQSCPLSHIGEPKGSCIARRCLECMKQKKICHFYQHKIPHPENCKYSHQGMPTGKCQDSCSECQKLSKIPCHHYHLKLKHPENCLYSHEGEPMGKCLRKNCKFCKIKRPPCHYYHKCGQCLKAKCSFSHYGKSAGECLLSECHLCDAEQEKLGEKEKKKNQKRLTLELPKWAVKKFYGIYFKTIPEMYPQAELKTFPNIVCLLYPKKYDIEEQIIKYWESITENFSQSLEKASLEYPIPGTARVAILRNGLEVTDILFPGEFISLRFTFAKKTGFDQIQQILDIDDEEIESMTVNEIGDSTEVLVKFMSKEKASECLEDFELNIREGVICRPVVKNNQISTLDCSVIVRFSTTKSLGNATLTYQNNLAPESLKTEIEMNQYSLDGNEIRVIIQGNTAILQGLSPLTNEYKLEKIGKLFGEVPTIQLQRAIPQQIGQDKFELMPEELAPFKDMIIHDSNNLPQKSKKYPNTYKVEFIFKNKDDAIIFADDIMSKTIYGYPVESVTLKYKMSIRIWNMIYKIFSNEIENLPETLKLLDPKTKFFFQAFDENAKKEENIPIVYWKKLLYLKNYLKDEAEFGSELRELENGFFEYREKIMEILKSESLSIKQNFTEFAFSTSMLNYYRELQRESKFKEKVFINSNPFIKLLQIYSNDDNFIQEIKDRILKRITKLSEKPEKINMQNYNLSRFRMFLKQKYPEKQLEWTHIDGQKREMVILTQDEAAKKVIQNALIINQKNQKEETKINDEDICPICLTNAATSKGVSCEHSFCIYCLEYTYELQSKKTSVFAVCPMEDCGAKVNPFDLAEIITSEALQLLITRHLTSYLAAHQNQFFFCLKGCPNFFKTSASLNLGSINCEICKKQLCVKELPPHQAHQGPCPNEEKSIRKNLLKDGNNKQMPCCGDIAEKPDGCNKVKCLCGWYVCWLCLAKYKNQDECYTHLIDTHGGIHKENEIDEIMMLMGAKKLKCCGNLAQKDGGCNKIHCPICGKFSCWRCLEDFKTQKECYHHLSQVHGGYWD